MEIKSIEDLKDERKKVLSELSELGKKSESFLPMMAFPACVRPKLFDGKEFLKLHEKQKNLYQQARNLSREIYSKQNEK